MDTYIIKTLSYFDVFDYPLTFEELKKYLGCKISCSDDELYDVLNSISVIQESGGYYYLLGRQEIVAKRSDRAANSVRKYAKAKIIAKILSAVPTIEYIGISGSLAMNNAAHSDDIDLFFITKKNTLWISRLIVNVILFMSAQKRKKNGLVVQDKICPNMFMEASRLSFTGKRRTLYTAHEILQLQTVFDRNYFYSRFVNQNKWVKDFLPNASVQKPPSFKSSPWVTLLEKIVLPIERVAYAMQLIYMHKQRSIELVRPKRAFFHPINRPKLILDMYELRYKRYKRLYEDNLWVDKDEARFYWEEKKTRILN